MMRRLVAVLVVVGICTSVPAAVADPPPVRAVCVGAPTCNNWFNTDVHLRWDITNGTVVAGCDEEWIRQDTPTDGLFRTCKAADPVPPHNTTTAEVRIFRDTVSPTIIGAVPARPPDFAGWYTHPVTFTPQATDATSLLAGCDAPSYAGPDAPSATVVATCRDKAGNSASRAFPLSYDATPPDPGPAAVKTGDRVVRLSWPAGADATVTRTPGTDGATSSMIFEGRGTGFRDREVRNNRKYRYTLTLTDDAGNTSSRELAAKPHRQLLAPQRAATLTAAPLLKWTPVRHTRYYNVQLFRDGHKILSRWPTHASLQLKHKWRFHGKRYRLKPDEYDWYVWPGEGRRAANRYGDRIGRRSFTVLAG